jgi:hypothetical protein
MTHVENSYLTGADDPTVDTSRLIRPLAAWTAGLTACYVVGQAISSRSDDNPSVRADWVTDCIAVVIASLLFATIAGAVAVWATRGDRSRQSRTVVGLTVFAVVLSPIGWWSAAPALVAVTAVLLGRATGVADRTDGSSAARTASIVATLLAVALFVFVWATLLVEAL